MLNIYQTFYDLLNRFVFGGSVVADSYEELSIIIVSLVATLFLGLLPFFIVWRVIRTFLR